MEQYDRPLSVMPSQVTEAKLIDIMSKSHTTFQHGHLIMEQCAAYFYASEASACLKDLYGGFIAAITAFYDCDTRFQKATIAGGEKPLTLNNVCFNLLAGSTFDYLGKLVTDDNIMGGFASRCTYIIQKDVIKRTSEWGQALRGNLSISEEHLADDLSRIQAMVGPFTADDDFREAWNEWFPIHDMEVQMHPNEKMQSLLSRKTTLIRKLPMIISAAESSDRILTGAHWERAVQLIDQAETNLPFMIREGRAKDTKTQAGLNNQILKIMQSRQMVAPNTLISECTMAGYKTGDVQKTLNGILADGNLLVIEGGRVKLVGDADLYI
jgi:hypothetical protein